MKRRLGRTELMIDPLVLGTNVLGWTIDEPMSFRLLDTFVDAGFTAIDTADSYSIWAEGNHSESEKIIGRWLAARGNRDTVLVFTKVGSDMGQGHKDLSAKWIEEEVEASLRRLRTEYIDLYQSHWLDPDTPHEETLGAYERLIAAGKVRYIGCSNFDAGNMADALATAEVRGLPRYETVQNQLNLCAPEKYLGPVQDFVVENGMSALAYFPLASGFLTGKYRSLADVEGKARAGMVKRFFDDNGLRILKAMDRITEARGVSHAEVALAWVNAQAGIAAPIASATSPEQLDALIRGARLVLDTEALQTLDAARG